MSAFLSRSTPSALQPLWAFSDALLCCPLPESERKGGSGPCAGALCTQHSEVSPRDLVMLTTADARSLEASV